MTGPLEGREGRPVRDDSSAERTLETSDPDGAAALSADTETDADTDADTEQESGKKKRGALREFAILITVAVVLY
ncbi:MAG TPA: hypothetical protein VEX40_14330, partial [Mycobacterium sp.]|nr:hypothetical protein [Mycobacterium sp.]